MAIVQFTQEQYDECIRRQKACKANHPPISSANVEQVISNAPLAKKEAQRLDTLRGCCLRIHSRRNRITDADGLSAKAVIDGLVLAGVFEDDSPEYIKEVWYSQEKIIGPEETIIEIWRS